MKVLNLRGFLCFKNNHITSIILLVWLNTLCVWYDTKAQFYKPSEKTVRMGETLPDSFYQTIHQAVNAKTGKTSTIQLKDHKNKLIILDFWASWCGPCIYSLNKLDSIIAPMSKENFIVIPVTYQSLIEAKPILDKYKWNMTSIISDTTLAQIFPHSGIPHQVWIKDGKVVAIPKWDYTTTQNIQKIIKGEPVKMIMNLKDGVVDIKKPLFIEGNGYTGSPPYFENKYSVIARRLRGFQQHSIKIVHINDTTIVYGYNLPLQYLFFTAFETEIFNRFSAKEGSGIYWEISDKLRKRLFEGPKQSFIGNIEQDNLHQAWLDKNNYGYNLRYPKNIAKEDMLKIMQKDLNYFFGAYLNLEAKIELRPKQVAVLYILKNKKTTCQLLKTKGGKIFLDNAIESDFFQLRNGSFRSFYTQLNKVYPHAILTDSTGIENLNVDTKITKKINGNPELANEALNKYGLNLVLKERMLPVLVIKERGRK